MLKLIILQAFRHLRKSKLYTSINVIGLTIGLLSFLLIMLYVSHEVSFDKFHSKSNRIYRLSSANKQRVGAMVPYVWGENLKNEWAEAQNVATIQNITIALTIEKDEEVYAQHGIVGADSTFFNIFDFPVVKGNRKEFLKTPNKMVITPNMSAKYFLGEDPIGKILRINLWGTYVTFEVEGIVRSPPNSHLQFEFLIPIHFVKKHFFSPKAFGSWNIHFAYTYVLLTDPNLYDYQHDKIRSDLKDFLERHGGKEMRDRITPDLEPLEDIYLKSKLKFDFPPRGNINHLLILIAVAFGILLMAIINFINISLAQSLRRMKEFGLKKILGSQKATLISQFIGESLLLSFLALMLVCILMAVIIPYFNEFTDKTFTLTEVFSFYNVLIMLVTTVTVGATSGIYPAIALSSFRPVSILSSRGANTTKGRQAQKVLVAAQFSLTILLLIATGVVYKQVVYMQHKELGFDEKQVIVMNDARQVASRPLKTKLFREELLKHQSIHNVSASSSYPGQQAWSSRYIPEGLEESESISISTIFADHDFLNTYDVKISEGRNFDRVFSSDSNAFLINQAAAKLFSGMDPLWKNPLNKKLKISRSDQQGSVIGVFKDFHFSSVKDQIAPLVISINPRNFFALQVEMETVNISETLAVIEANWKKLFPDIPYTYSYLDQKLAAHYESDEKMGQILQVFTVLSIVVAVLGLFGLASLLVLEKTREMGIRKIVGATEKQLLGLLMTLFLKIVIIANFVAIPLGFFLMDTWLDDFAYRIDMPYAVFVLAGVSSLLITILTIAYHSWKTATINPVDVLVEN